ncbi:hypothetical protein [Azospirillum sp.]|uniref:hypothetical protein n=1 Tax=Azospirillum sp. TaxID=34012 RepID=UPI003D743913
MTSTRTERFRREAEELAERERLVEIALAHRVVSLDHGEALDTARLTPESGTLTGLACGVCTIGPRLERRVSALFAERRMSLALALDAYGNARLRDAVRRLQDRMLAEVRRQRLSMAGELRPGDPGMALEAQPAVLRLADAERIGVAVTHGLALSPAKSASMVLGVGIDLPPARWSRCDDCPTAPRCRMRETSDA